EPAARAAVRQLDLRAVGIPEPGAEWTDRYRGTPGWAELYFGGQRQTIARWPNEGWSRIAAVTGGQPFDVRGTVGDKVGRFTYQGERPARWVDEPELWLHGFWFWDWSDQRQRVEQIDPATRTISLVPPHHYYGYRKNQGWYAFNALCELDSPGEYYLDRQRWTLYFWPPAEPAGQELALSLLTVPFATLTDVSHVTLRDLTFELSRGEGIQIRGGTGNRIAGCNLRNLSKLAIRIDGGTDHGVQSCDLSGLGVGGISLSGGDRASLTPAGHFADNNYIHHFAQLVHTYQNGISLSGVGCRMAHNLLHNTVHEALTYRGNDHRVELNEVYDVCLEADDSGVIHQGRDWTWRGNVIRHNFFHDIPAGNAVSNMGVYLDDMECGVEVYGNVLYRIPRAILVGGGRDNAVRNNLIIDCPTALSIDNRAMNWASYHVGTTMKGLLDKVPYQQEPWRSRYPELLSIWSDEPAVPKGNVVRDNLAVRSGPFELSGEVTRYGEVRDNATTAEDPGFADPQRLDFTLTDLAAVRRLVPGFEPIPFGAIGLYRDEYRRELPLRRPTISPAGQSFVEELEVVLQSGRGRAAEAIYFTTDGSLPTTASDRYTRPLRLTEDTTVTALAVVGDETSTVSRAHFRAHHLGPRGGVPLTELAFTEPQAHAGVKVNRNYASSGPVSLGGQPYARSLMICPAAAPPGGRGQAVFALTNGLERATTLTARVGLDDVVKTNGSVVFIVEVLRDGAWEQVYQSRLLRGGQSEAIEVPIAGASAIKLVTTDGGDNIHSDHAVWAEPMLR
ncbi:MAG: NPCBM/NEW2 domain-containing protein, partial [Armatimonadetes bacterium]|nr:NPCBM/NEW2 domain-containing protein [Armatimonadota bacterium]